jgi:hypothetical protein
MGIAWTWFFCISIPMAPQFYHEGVAKSRSISFKFHHSIIGPLYAIPSFFVFDIVMRNIKKKKK